MYVAGWIKRGPVGVLASTMQDAYETATAILEDMDKTVAPGSDKDGYAGVMSLLAQRRIRTVSFADWKRIDDEEVRRGAASGKPREKIVLLEDIWNILD